MPRPSLKNNTGLLWFDDDPRTDLQTKIRRLVQYYQQKFGFYPNLCYVHKSELDDGKVTRIDETEIRTGQSVLKHHFWIGRIKKRRKSR